MGAEALPAYKFDRFLLDIQRGVLLADGAECPLRAKSFTLLRLFVENAGRLIDRDEIMRAVWPGIFVTDDSIAQCIREIRRTLGDTDQRLLRTLPRRGYRFIAPVVTAHAAVAPQTEPASPRADVPASGYDAERRQITAMSCELIGLSERADGDLEAMREAAAAEQRRISEIAARHGGFIVNRQGNTLLVVFGYPVALEHNAELAVRSGLEMCTAMGTARPGAAAGSAGCRIGVATGVVIIGNRVDDDEVMVQEIVGTAPILAARLQLSARPDTMVIDATTRQLIGNLFDCRDLGPMMAMTGAEPAHHWQVLGMRAGESRFEALRGPALSALIGRDEEIDLLLRRWRRARMEDGQVVLISGEPGIGKSRLTAELEQRIRAEPHSLLRYFCSPYHRDSALYPITDQLGRASGFAPDDSPAARLPKLEALLGRAATQDEDVALIADLLSLPSSERHPVPNLSPQRKKERTLDALIRTLEGLARQQPVLMVFEDAQWVDPTSLELLDLALERTRNLPVLLIVTFRPEFQPVWTGEPQVTMLTLNRLDRHDRGALVMQIAGDTALPDEVVAQLVDRTDGVPLFIEELTKSVLESGAPLVGVPTTLRDSLMARLDRLGPVRLVAQIGAAIGRQFSYGLLRAVAELPEHELRAALARLVASELVFQRGTPPEAVWTFKHALIQDAAHGSLLRKTRQQLHAKIAAALDTLSPGLIDTQAELFAHHYAEAGLVEKSIACWVKAGRRSVARSASAEAAAQFQKGLEQLALLPDTRERQRQELEFCSALGAVLTAVKGFAAPETGRAYARARELWQQLGSPSEFFDVPVGHMQYHALRGELHLALRLAEELLRLGRERNDPVGLRMGHGSVGARLMFAGRFTDARSHLEAALALSDPISNRVLAQWAARFRSGQGAPPVSLGGNLGIVLFCLGYPDQALAGLKAIIVETRMLAHPPSLVLSQVFGAILLSLVGDDAALGEQADELVAGAIEHGFPLYHAQGTIFRGWAEVMHGKVSAGITLLRSGLSAYHATGSEVWMPHYRALLAQALEIAGETEAAAASLQDALHNVDRTGERWFEAELNRQQGELLLRQGHCEHAEQLFCKALSIAREQQAKMWELRAVISLARLRRDRGRHADVRAILGPVHEWFTEGFDTPDLKQAKALLDEAG